MNWGKLDIETIFRGKSPEGTRYLITFLKDYNNLIKPKELPIANCKKCLRTYIYEFLTYKPMEKLTQNYQLHPKYEGITIFGTGLVINNSNITDELGKRLLKEHPAGSKLFSIYPKDVKGINKAKIAKDLKDAQDLKDAKDAKNAKIAQDLKDAEDVDNEFNVEYQTAIAGNKSELLAFAEKYDIVLDDEATNNEKRKAVIVKWYENLDPAE